MVLETEQHVEAESGRTKRSLWTQIWFIAFAAFALRLIAVPFLVGDELDPARDYWNFGWETGRIAHSLASGHGFGSPFFGWTGATAWMGPIYPCLLAAIFKIFGIYSKASAYVILSLNCLFAAVICLPVHAIGHRVFGTRTATVAAWVWALFPYSFEFSADRIWCTELSAALFTLVIALTLALEEKCKARSWVAWGMLWALCGLTEPSLLICLPVAGLWRCFGFVSAVGLGSSYGGQPWPH